MTSLPLSRNHNNTYQIEPCIYKWSLSLLLVFRKNNTALHEAVSLGPKGGKEGVSKLLSLGASTKVKNNKDETAYAQASREGHESVIAAFASTAGQGMLNKLMRQTSKITLDDDGF